ARAGGRASEWGIGRARAPASAPRLPRALPRRISLGSHAIWPPVRAGIILRMVTIVHAPPPGSLVTADSKAFAAWLERVGAAYSPDERSAIAKALDAARIRYGGLTTADGEPWLDRALGAAAIVAGLKVDVDSVRAAILLGAPSVASF